MNANFVPLSLLRHSQFQKTLSSTIFALIKSLPLLSFYHPKLNYKKRRSLLTFFSLQYSHYYTDTEFWHSYLSTFFFSIALQCLSSHQSTSTFLFLLFWHLPTSWLPSSLNLLVTQPTSPPHIRQKNPAFHQPRPTQLLSSSISTYQLPLYFSISLLFSSFCVCLRSSQTVSIHILFIIPSTSAYHPPSPSFDFLFYALAPPVLPFSPFLKQHTLSSEPHRIRNTVPSSSYHQPHCTNRLFFFWTHVHL